MFGSRTPVCFPKPQYEEERLATWLQCYPPSSRADASVPGASLTSLGYGVIRFGNARVTGSGNAMMDEGRH